MRAQLWLWFVGVIVTTFPWHWVGLLGMPRRMAYFDYSASGLSADAVWVDPLRFRRIHPPRVSGCSVPCNPHPRPMGACGRDRSPTASRRRFILRVAVPAALNGFGLWIALMVGLTITNYGYPILQLAFRPGGAVPAVYVGAQR